MPYTLMKGFGWVIASGILGMIVGWLLRSVSAKRQVTRARSNTADVAELDRLRRRVAELEPVVDERDRLRRELDEVRSPVEPPSGPAAALDDLTAIDGIDASVAALCSGIGIGSWTDLAGTEVSLLRTMLADAGPEFADVDPATWPGQAADLAASAAEARID